MQESTHLIAAPAGQLEVRLTQPADWQATTPYVVCAHPHPQHGGSLTNKVVHTLAKSFAEQGLLAVRFNFRGVGQSQGEFDQGHGEQDDLLTVVKWLQQQYPTSSCWLAGFSFGAYIAAAVAARATAQALILVAPAVHLFDVRDIHLTAIPTLVLMGKQDEIVPIAVVQQWLAQQKIPPQTIWFDDVGHFFHGKLALLSNACQQFTQQQRS